MKTYGDSAQSFFAFDSATDLIRIMTHSQRRSHSEYSDYAKGEFRSSPISVATELPYTWFVGGTPFHTLGLLAEAETGGLDGETIFYAGVDASPRKGNTGVTMAGNGAVSIQVTPPAQGNYTLSIRHKGASNGDQYRYQIDGGEVFIRTVMATSFGYENIMLNDLSAQSHSVRVGAVSGRVDVDYVLLCSNESIRKHAGCNRVSRRCSSSGLSPYLSPFDQASRRWVTQASTQNWGRSIAQ